MSASSIAQCIAPAVISLSALYLTSCTKLGPDYTAPESITPDAWNQSLPGSSKSSEASLQSWWRHYQDPTLNQLIRSAEEANLDLAAASERVLQAKANRNATASVLFPQISGIGAYNRSRGTENGLVPPPFGGATNHLYDTGLDAAWEIDFWGKNRRLVEAANASAAASVELLNDARLSIFTEVAVAYIELRTVEQRISITRQNLETQRGSVKIAQDRLDAGLVPELDLTQAQANEATTEAIIPQLQQQRIAIVNRIAVLLGKFPNQVEPLLSKSQGIPIPKKSVSKGLPTDLIRARPDIRASERTLAAASALIGSAKAELYPQFTLGGTFTLQAINSDDLLQSGSRNYSFGPRFQWNLFNAGRIRNLISISESETREAFYNYEQTVLSAVSEVETNMAQLRYERARLASLNKAVTAARKSRDLLKANYKEGLIPFQNVLDAERVLLQAEDNRAASQGQIAANYATLYKALGGGTRVQSK